MRKALLTLGIVVAVVVVAIVALASTKPSTFTVTRSIDIAAPPAKIAPLITDFHNFKSWSPWEHLDPNMTTQITGTTSAPGSVYSWQGNSQAGTGSMTWLAITPTRMDGQLDFTKPFVAHNFYTWTLTPISPTTTHVTWEMNGPMPFMTKVMSVFSSMDKMVGPDFDHGLANLKVLAEK